MAAADPVIVDFESLPSSASAPQPEALLDAVARAFGPGGLGLIVVRGVPGYAEARRECLPFARRFATLPDEVRARYEDAASFYSFGWSHGKEKLEGKPDVAKGSFYFNPVYDAPAVGDEAVRFAPFFAPNVWPSDAHCAGFEAANKRLARLLVDAGRRLAAAVDAHVKRRLPRFEARLADVIERSRNAKARLLYYFPAGGDEGGGEAGEAAGGDGDVISSWCGWHNDHGSLTALASAMYFDAAGAEIACPDPAAGLYVKSRGGATVRVSIPPDCCAFQIGETAQIMSGGVLQATPHCVRAARGHGCAGVARATLAVFMEPGPDGAMAPPEGADLGGLLASSGLLPRGVPPLQGRWEARDPPMSFGEFTDRTLKSYY
jgi:isopenicillin N synthase-like dioxygenase